MTTASMIAMIKPQCRRVRAKKMRIANRQRETRQLRRADQPGCFGYVVKARFRRIQQYAVKQKIHHLHGDLIEHDRAQDLVHIEVRFEETSQPAIERAGQKAADERTSYDDQIKCAGRFRHLGRDARLTQYERDGDASQSAGDHLPFPADIDHAAAGRRS